MDRDQRRVRQPGLWRVARQALVVLAVALAGAAITYAFHPQRPYFFADNEPLEEGEVRWSEVAERWGDPSAVVWVDARMREKFDASHLENALLLNEQEWWDQLDLVVEPLLEAATTGQAVVVYCGSHACQASKKVAARLRDEVGLPEVYVLKGGWPALVKAGAPVVEAE